MQECKRRSAQLKLAAQEICVGFTLEAKFVSSKQLLIQEHVEIVSLSEETWLQTC